MRAYIYDLKARAHKSDAEKLIGDSKEQAEKIIREAKLNAKEIAAEYRQKVEDEYRAQRQELQELEKQTRQKESNLENRLENIIKREEQIIGQQADLKKKDEEAERLKRGLAQKNQELDSQLSRVAQMSREEAQQKLIDSVRQQSEYEIAKVVKEAEDEAREQSQKKARDIISSAIQRYAGDVVNEITVSAVSLPSDEMKGRLIGREGRNIRAFENATGVNIIIDDTPETVVISSFNPIRREIARRAMESLIVDGRIHPGRIEEVIKKTEREVDGVIREAAEEVLMDLDVQKLHPELKKLVGRLKFRTSYGQNVLMHSIEVARMTGIMAAELGLNERLAIRAGILHDIGKAVDFEIEGSHAKIGAELAKKYGENAVVINAIESHHEDVEATNAISVLVAAADALSAARPGARRETLATYIKRVEKLEEIANSFSGVEKSYAIQAGREVRIIVRPNEVDEVMAHKIAHDIANKIEQEMEYPGKIKAVVIRETRAEAEAK